MTLSYSIESVTQVQQPLSGYSAAASPSRALELCAHIGLQNMSAQLLVKEFQFLNM